MLSVPGFIALQEAREFSLRTLLVIVVGVGTLLVGCQPSGEPVHIWSVWEQRFTAADSVAPETAFTVTFTGPDGETETVPGYWDGGSDWEVRFRPDATGEWSYETSTDPSVEGLSGQSGSFRVVDPDTSENPFLQHGPIRVAGNNRHFEHADGTPFFWVGDTAWNGALKSTGDGWHTYLQDRVEKGFTGIQFVTTQWRAAPSNAEDEVAYSGYEDITLHPEFFDRMDSRIEAINRHGLLAAPVMLWALGDKKQVPGHLPAEEASRLAEYLRARYHAHHILWLLGGDGSYDDTEKWTSIGQTVFGDLEEHAPVTLHAQGMSWPFDAYWNQAWMDYAGYQSGHDHNAGAVRWIYDGPANEWWQKTPTRPIVNLEPSYEDHRAYSSGDRLSAFDIRRAIYLSLLNAPPVGVSYGAHGIWSWETSRREPLNHEGSGVATPWREAIDLPGGQDVRHVSDLFTSFDWWTLRPDPQLVEAQPFPEQPTRHVSAASNDAGTLAVVYLPVGATVDLDLNVLSGDVSASWFNPRESGFQETSAQGPDDQFAAPDENDWVLLLRQDE